MDDYIPQVGKGQLDGMLANARMDRARRAAGRDEAADAAREFESLFATMLVKELRATLPTGLFGSGPGVDVFEGWFDERIGEVLADNGALELAGFLKTALARAKAGGDQVNESNAVQGRGTE